MTPSPFPKDRPLEPRWNTDGTNVIWCLGQISSKKRFGYAQRACYPVTAHRIGSEKDFPVEAVADDVERRADVAEPERAPGAVVQ